MFVPTSAAQVPMFAVLLSVIDMILWNGPVGPFVVPPKIVSLYVTVHGYVALAGTASVLWNTPSWFASFVFVIVTPVGAAVAVLAAISVPTAARHAAIRTIRAYRFLIVPSRWMRPSLGDWRPRCVPRAGRRAPRCCSTPSDSVLLGKYHPSR